ncbi:MAG: protein kinase [Candidatus Eiseniibacteriota bacterium]|nr:MAG: protein kinase [Candidatus Eisenbacteria bacterium]
MMSKTISHYEILEKLGEGGMGVVYRARDTRLNRDVAIKFLPERLAGRSEQRERLRKEARSAAALSHPNIAGVYAFEETDDQLFIVMEYVEGQNLSEAIRSGTLKLDVTLDLIEGVSDGLKAAHSKGIIHRDIKSNNIMVTPDGRAKIMDFGLAKIKGGTAITKTGAAVGTIAYMSPEQVRGAKVDNRSDIWALGVVFYEMLTGELPFRSDNDAALIYCITNEDPLEPDELGSNIPSELYSIAMKMLEKDPERRYASVEELTGDLEDFRQRQDSSESAAAAKVIAVLPFKNISPEKEGDYFSDGLTEELIMSLSRLRDMHVISRTTSMLYKNTTKSIKMIGRELNAGYILEGSVRRFRDDLRITAELVDVRSDTQLWAENFSGHIADVFDIQEKVSGQIVDALMLRLSPTEKIVLTKRPTVNMDAYDLNQRARGFLYQRSKSKLNIAIGLFERAIQLDPRYANAYAGLAEAYGTLYQLFETKDVWLEKSMEAGLKALMYDSSLSQAYSALGLCYFNKGSLDEALEASRKAIELDPSDHAAHWILGRIYYLSDRDAEAIEQYKKVLELNPDFFSVYNDLLLSYQRLGDKEGYLEMLHVSLEAYPRYLAQHPADGRAHIHFAVRLAEAGRLDEGKKHAEEAIRLNPTDPLMLYNVACFYARIGEVALAIRRLKESIAAGYELYEWIKRDADLENLRDEPEYLKLMEGK